MEKKLVVGNLKMNLASLGERDKYLEFLKKESQGKKLEKVETVICPSFVHLDHFSKKLGKGFELGAQDCFSEERGSYTGEVSPVLLREIGCKYVILGHSERRRFQAETDDEIALKVVASIKAGLFPIVCVGENVEDRDSGKFSRAVGSQLVRSLARVKPALMEKVTIAYEPIWSVGTDVIPTANQIMEMKVLIRKILSETFGRKYGEKPKIIYGGSVNSRTAKETCLDPDMDGVLVGRESLVPGEFLRIAGIINKGR